MLGNLWNAVSQKVTSIVPGMTDNSTGNNNVQSQASQNHQKLQQQQQAALQAQRRKDQVTCLYEFTKDPSLDAKQYLVTEGVKGGGVFTETQFYVISYLPPNGAREEIKITRRYTDFDQLYNELRYVYPGLIMPKPPRKDAYLKFSDKFLTEQQTRDRKKFLRERICGLRVFIEALMKHSELRYCEQVKTFLKDQAGWEIAGMSHISDRLEENQQQEGFLKNTLNLITGKIFGNQQVNFPPRTADDWEAKYRQDRDRFCAQAKSIERIVTIVSIQRKSIAEQSANASQFQKKMQELVAPAREEGPTTVETHDAQDAQLFEALSNTLTEVTHAQQSAEEEKLLLLQSQLASLQGQYEVAAESIDELFAAIEEAFKARLMRQYDSANAKRYEEKEIQQRERVQKIRKNFDFDLQTVPQQLQRELDQLLQLYHQAISEHAENPLTVVTYEVREQVAYITLNRPQRYNAITVSMPEEIERAVLRANFDKDVRVIVLSGAGNSFCSGYDLKLYAEGERGSMPASQKMPWDPYTDYTFMRASTDKFMSLFHSHKPTICKIHGYAVAGGSDIALCCDLIVMAEDAQIGYPPSRVWGCPTTAMWTFRVGAQQAKKLLFTGELISGLEALKIGLVSECCKKEDLDARVESLAQRIKTVPTNQLWMQKQVVNSVLENMGLLQTQRLATIFDGMSRHTPEGVQFQKRAHEVGFKQAVLERDQPNNQATRVTQKLPESETKAKL